MSIFNKTKQINSQICIKAKYKISINEKEINQTQFFTENYIYTEAGNQKIIYLPKEDTQYIIDTENKQLKELDLSAQMMQMNQLKGMIGEVDIEERTEDETRYITIQNKNESPAQLKAEIQIIKQKGLEKTVYKKFNKSQENTQIFSLNLKANEIIKLSETVFTFNGQEQKTKLELINIEDNTDCVSKIDAYNNYKIAKK